MWHCLILCFPVGIYLLKVNNRNIRTKCEICSKLTIKIPERRKSDLNNVALVSLLRTLNRFYTLVWHFYCWLWTSKYWLGVLRKSKNCKPLLLQIAFWRFMKDICIYSQTCIRRSLLGPLKSGRLGQVIVLSNIFIKRPQTKSGRSWQVVTFYSHCEWFINNLKVCWNRDLPFRMFLCHSWRLKMFLVTFDFEYTYIKKCCYASGVYKWV